MNENTVLIVAVVAIAVIVVLLMFRERLRSFGFKAGKDGLEANLETSQQGKSQGSRSRSVEISGNKQIGKGNEIDVGRSNVNVEENLQRGNNQKIVVRSQKSTSKPKSKSAGNKKKR